MIDSLCDHGGVENIAVVAFYCDFLSQEEQTINNIVGAILKQLVGRGGSRRVYASRFKKRKERSVVEGHDLRI